MGLANANGKVEAGHAAATSNVAERAAPFRAIFRTDPAESINEAALLARLNSVLRELGLAEVPASKELENRKAQVAGDLGGAEQNARLAGLGALKTGAQQIGRGSDREKIVNAQVDAVGNLG